MSDELDVQQIRRKLEKRFEERNNFFIHVVIYIIINVLLWLVWLIIPTVFQDFPKELAAFPAPLVVMFAWGSGLTAHWLDYYMKYGPGADRREREIQREIERYREQTYNHDKPKRDRRVALSDDGELQDVNEDWEGDRRQGRHSLN
jgi:hypothetical protein